MKKIFAIALAAVMVLSMASAFALSDCFGNFAWPCDTTTFCGRGSVEIVPFVRANSACGYVLQVSECAGATPGMPVFYAVKLNVEANPDSVANADALKPQAMYWWDAIWTQDPSDVNDPGATGVVITFKKMVDNTLAPLAKIDLPVNSTDADCAKIDWDADKAKSYYYDWTNTEWINVEDVDDLDDVVTSALVDPTVDASKAEICAELYSKNNGQGVWYYGDYKVDTSTPNELVVEKGAGNKVTYTIDPATGEEKVVSNPKDFAAEVSKLFNMANCTLGTCMTEKNIAKNFGWDTDHELKDCFKWAGATAIVDSDCVVAIPKTGDASLLAWLF